MFFLFVTVTIQDQRYPVANGEHNSQTQTVKCIKYYYLMAHQAISPIKRRASEPLENLSEISAEILASALKISFKDPEDSFISIKWPVISALLNTISNCWEFVAFGFDHKSAIITTTDKGSADNLQKLVSVESFGVCKSIFVEQLKGGLSKGIIYNKFLIPLGEEEILNELQNQDVTEIYRLQKNNECLNERFFTGSIILSFNSDNIPANVEINKVRISVNRLSPRPMVCSTCGLIGHTFKRCKNTNRGNCSICFFPHNIDTECMKNCKNCNIADDHFSNDSKCPSIKKEIRILRIKEKHNINYFDAKAIANNILDFDIDLENKKSEENINELKELMAKNSRYLSELNFAREENKRISGNLTLLQEENVELKTVTIPNLNSKFQQYKEENDARTNNIKLLMEQHIEKNRIETEILTKENIDIGTECNKLKEENNELRKINEELKTQDKVKQEMIKNSKSFINDFANSSTQNATAMKEFSQNNKNHPFMAEGLRRNSIGKKNQNSNK